MDCQRCLEGKREHQGDDEGVADLQLRRGERAHVAHLPARVHAGRRIRDRGDDQRDLAGEAGREAGTQVRPDQRNHANESQQQSCDAVDGPRLVGEDERRQHDREQRHGPVEDGGERRVDRLLAPGDERERDDDPQQRHDQQVEIGVSAARQMLPGDAHGEREDRSTDSQPASYQRERRERLDPDLDEQVAAAPREAERKEDEPCGSWGS